MASRQLSEDEELALALQESMKYTNEPANQPVSNPPSYYKNYRGDTKEDEDIAKVKLMSLKDQGNSEPHARPIHQPVSNPPSYYKNYRGDTKEDEEVAKVKCLSLKDQGNSEPHARPINQPVLNPPSYYKNYPGDNKEDEDIAKVKFLSVKDQGYSGDHPIPRPKTQTSPGTRQIDRELRLVLLGMTGAGKSSTANTILGRDHFKADCNGSSITFKCDHATTRVEVRDVLVVDTPGLFDTRYGNDVTMREILRCVGLSAPGPHALILVVQGGNRQTEQVQKCADIILDVFGEHARRYMIVLFTHRDDLKHHRKLLPTFAKTLPEKMKQVLSECGNRYLAFDNRVESPEERQAQVTGLLHMIDNMVTKNGDRCYTNDVFKEFEKKVADRERSLIEELKKQREEDARVFQARVEKETQEKLDKVQKDALAFQARVERETQQQLKQVREDASQQAAIMERREREREQQVYQQEVVEQEQKRIHEEKAIRIQQQAQEAGETRDLKEAQIRTEVRKEIQGDDSDKSDLIKAVVKVAKGVHSVVEGVFGIAKLYKSVFS